MSPGPSIPQAGPDGFTDTSLLPRRPPLRHGFSEPCALTLSVWVHKTGRHKAGLLVSPTSQAGAYLSIAIEASLVGMDVTPS